MKPHELQCTAHVSGGPGKEFEDRWYVEVVKPERLTLTHIYWTKSAAAAAAVTLSPAHSAVSHSLYR